ncbi:MAG: leucine--tRNA ligase [Candidatus Micrarchaeota archaeon]
MDYASIQKKWVEEWFLGKWFEPVVDSGKEKFFFTVPYPYVTGNLHVGHGRSYVNADVVARFKRMQGFNVLWPMGFHVSGTPVLAVSDKIKKKDAETLALYDEYLSAYEDNEAERKKIISSFIEPWNVVNYFSKKLVQDFQRLGVSIDYSRQFTTGDVEYNAFVKWQFLKYAENNLLKQGAYPVLFSPEEQNAVGEDDIKDADTEPVEVMDFIAIKSKLGDAFILSSTLRPETVFGITNLFVDPAGDYVRVLVDGEKIVCSKIAAEKLGFQNHEVKLEKEFKGKDLVGETVETPLGVVVPVFPAIFVDVSNASGVVHSVPAHAPYDFQALIDLRKDKKTLYEYGLEKFLKKLVPIPVISVEGFSEIPARDLCEEMSIANIRETQKLDKATKELYKQEYYSGKMLDSNKEFSGLSVEQAKLKVGAWLKKQGNAISFYETSRKAFTRHGDKVIVGVMKDQWFLDYNSPGWKKKSFNCLDKMKIIPEQYRKQFKDVFDWLDKRPCARRRGLGTQLPFNNEWVIESLSDSTFYPAFYTVIKQIKENELKPESLTEEFFDFVFQGKGNASDVSKKTRVKESVLESIKNEFDYWYPCDQRHTAIAHISNHLSFYVFAHTALMPEEKWPKAISLNELVIAEGKKMSKSKGNVVTLHKLFADYSVDLVRLYLVNAAELSGTLDFRLKEVTALQKTFNKLLFVFEELTRLKKNTEMKDSSLTKWLLSKFESRLKDATLAVEEMRLRDYSQKAVFDLLNDYEYFSSRASIEEKSFIAQEISVKWIALLSPLMPFHCDELSDGKASLSLWPSVREELIDLKVEAEEDYLHNVLVDVRKISSLMKNKKVLSAKIIVASKEKKTQAINLVKTHDSPDSLEESELNNFLKKRFYEFRSNPLLLQLDESSKLTVSKEFIEKTLGFEISIEKEEESSEEKRVKAMPCKPSVLLIFS